MAESQDPNQQPPALAQPKEPDQLEVSVVSTSAEGRCAWLKKDKSLFAARYFVLAMLIAAFFAGIPFIGYFRWRSTLCKEYDELACNINPDKSLSGFYVLYKSDRCMAAGYSLMVIALIVFIPRVILGSLSFGSKGIRRLIGLIGLGLIVLTSILIIISVSLVTFGGTKHLAVDGDGRLDVRSLWGFFQIKIKETGNTERFPTALNTALPMKAIYWLALIGAIPLIVFEGLALRGAR